MLGSSKAGSYRGLAAKGWAHRRQKNDEANLHPLMSYHGAFFTYSSRPDWSRK
jgi:hypothetical protein